MTQEDEDRIELVLAQNQELTKKSEDLGARLTQVSNFTQRSRQFIYGVVALTIVSALLAVGVGLSLPRVLRNSEDLAHNEDVTNAVAKSTHELCLKVEDLKASDLALWKFILELPRDASRPPTDPTVLAQFQLILSKFNPTQCP